MAAAEPQRRWAAGMLRATSTWMILAAGAALVGCIERAEPASYLIPSGYVGEVFIIFGVPDGTPPEMREGRRIYRIPQGGILRTQLAPSYGWSQPRYFYAAPSGDENVAIPCGPAGTIHDNPENRSNPTVEILAEVDGGTGAPVPGEPGPFSSNAPCSVKYRSFFVGTRAQFLDYERHLDVTEYLKQNPVKCEPAAQQAAEAAGRGLQPRVRPGSTRAVVGSRAAAA